MKRGARSSKAPAVARKQLPPTEPTICDRCGAVFLNRTWRWRTRARAALIEGAAWGICPACRDVADGRYFGRLVARFGDVPANREMIRRRIANTARRAGFTQPERRITSLEWNDSTLEVLTTSQKLTHRIATELRKAFGGRTRFQWSQADGSLLATWNP